MNALDRQQRQINAETAEWRGHLESRIEDLNTAIGMLARSQQLPTVAAQEVEPRMEP